MLNRFHRPAARSLETRRRTTSDAALKLSGGGALLHAPPSAPSTAASTSSSADDSPSNPRTPAAPPTRSTRPSRLELDPTHAVPFRTTAASTRSSSTTNAKHELTRAPPVHSPPSLAPDTRPATSRRPPPSSRSFRSHRQIYDDHKLADDGLNPCPPCRPHPEHQPAIPTPASLSRALISQDELNDSDRARTRHMQPFRMYRQGRESFWQIFVAGSVFHRQPRRPHRRHRRRPSGLPHRRDPRARPSSVTPVAAGSQG